MMKKTTQFVSGICVVAITMFQVSAQEPCGTYQKINELKASDPAAAAAIEQSEQELEDFTQDFIQNTYPQLQSQRVAPYTIPVVFHILHTNGSENISDEQVYDAMEKMNEDFNKLNNWANSVGSFHPIIADVEVELKLAKRDNNGDCTKGITRTFTQTTHNGDDGSSQVAAVQNAQGFWPSTKYINIFVVADAGGAAGYTTKPNNWGSATSMQKGIWILHNYVGRIGTSSPGVATALTHEVGHWLNLDHLWGGSNNPNEPGNCSIDDGVADTPNTLGWTSCNLNGTTCDAILDNVENFMEYSYCSKMYTEGQKARMHAALNSGTGGRNNVWQNSNLTATGVNEPDILCKAEFRSNKTTICAGDQIEFFDDSFHDVTGWTWTFTGGTPATSTAQNPVVTYSQAGTYAVSLTATDGSTSDSETKTAFITVLPEGTPLPFEENFENVSSLIFPDWEVVNLDNDATFQVYNGVSASGGQKSVRLYNYGAGSGRVDELVSGPIDLENVTPLIMTFKYAYKKRNQSNNEKLQVLFSNDCGETWSIRKNIQGSTLGSDIQSTAFNSPLESDWKMETIDNISFTSFDVANFKVKFVFESDEGNNLFIDDINILNSSASTYDFEKVIALNVFPNPTKGNTKIELNIPQSDELNISVKDYLGREIYIANKGIQSQGSKSFELPSSDWANGMYMIHVTVGENTITKKLMKK